MHQRAFIKNIDKSGQVSFEKLDPGKSHGIYHGLLYIDPKVCVRCGECEKACPTGAIKLSKVVKLMRQPKFKNINVTCPHDCPDTCSLVVTVDKSSGKAVKLKGNDKHPITKGFLCNKVNHYLDLVYNKNRVLYPHVRIGSKGSKVNLKKYHGIML